MDRWAFATDRLAPRCLTARRATLRRQALAVPLRRRALLTRLHRPAKTMGTTLGCLALLATALLACAPAALAAEGTGKISGTVTEAASPHNGIAQIEVTVYETGESEFPVGSAITGEHGEYTVEGLASGHYEVEFSPEFESGLNYVSQYYKDESSSATAEPVKVVQGETTKEIDAEMQVGGELEGTVTAACACEEHNPLKGIEVTAYKVGESKFPVGYATTNEKGEYTIAGLVSGAYEVKFAPGESGLNYVFQYYMDKPSLAAAEQVIVIQGKAMEKIDAELQEGGKIEGTVTDALTHTPLAGIYVVAVGSGEAFAAAADTNASGEYTLLGLASGTYKLEFASAHYILQYYDDQPSLASANLVTANQGSTTPGIDAALVRKAPVNAGAPVVSGAPAVGQTLSCSSGSWTGEPTPAFTYAWLRNGSAIAGATASTYLVQSTDQDTGLACKVTATNKYGSAAAVSNTLTVPAAPPPPPPVPVITLSSAKIVVSGGAARVPLACANANCTGTIELTEQLVVEHRHHGRTKSKRETLILGKGSYALSAGQRATILVRLTHTGKHVLARARRHRLSATLLASVTGGLRVRQPVVLSELVHRRRRR